MPRWKQHAANGKPHVKCPLVHGGMKLSDYDRGTPSVCRASIVTWSVILHFYSQSVQKLGQRSDIQSAEVSMVTWPIKARLIGLLTCSCTQKNYQCKEGERAVKRGGSAREVQTTWRQGSSKISKMVPRTASVHFHMSLVLRFQKPLIHDSRIPRTPVVQTMIKTACVDYCVDF